MGVCPVCSGQVADDFGLVECESCGAQLIVHVDGRVEFSGNQQEEHASEEFSLGPGVDGDLPPDNVVVAKEPADFDGTDPQDAAEAPPVYSSPGGAIGSPNLSDLADFANSEDSGGREGSLRYTLMVTGIDTADVREAFREALTDRKFMWDIEQILRSIREGNVKIENVTPGKAFILIHRLRNLPVQIRWEQHAVHST